MLLSLSHVGKVSLVYARTEPEAAVRAGKTVRRPTSAPATASRSSASSRRARWRWSSLRNNPRETTRGSAAATGSPPTGGRIGHFSTSSSCAALLGVDQATAVRDKGANAATVAPRDGAFPVHDGGEVYQITIRPRAAGVTDVYLPHTLSATSYSRNSRRRRHTPGRL